MRPRGTSSWKLKTSLQTPRTISTPTRSPQANHVELVRPLVHRVRGVSRPYPSYKASIRRRDPFPPRAISNLWRFGLHSRGPRTPTFDRGASAQRFGVKAGESGQALRLSLAKHVMLYVQLGVNRRLRCLLRDRLWDLIKSIGKEENWMSFELSILSYVWVSSHDFAKASLGVVSYRHSQYHESPGIR